MLEAAETGQSLDSETYDQLETELRTSLIQTQVQLEKTSFATLVVISGDDPEAARDVLNLMSEWLDPRFVQTCVFTDPTEEERLRPHAWRYWLQLPRAGRIAVFSNDWTTRLIALKLRGKVSRRDFTQGLADIERFERMIAVDGGAILKFYLHRPEVELEKARKALKREAAWSDVAEIGKCLLKRPRHTRTLVEQVLQHTGTGFAPWHLVESTCPRYRKIAVMRTLLEALKARIEKARETCSSPAETEASASMPFAPHTPRKSVLDSVDLSTTLSDDEYDQEMDDLRKQLRKLTSRAHEKGVSTVAAFEGWDAAGKGGAIRRLAQSMNPEMYRIIPIAAPNDVEKAHHYLWRFWRHLPRDGGFVIFDRTWYGRVLVERVERFATDAQWQRAYDEINYFENQLTRHGMLVLKFWLHIDKEEQLRRFKAREETPFKQYKIGPEDYRNREKWDQYVHAVDDMVARTSTPEAPWHLIPSNSKNVARVQVLRAVVSAMKERV